MNSVFAKRGMAQNSQMGVEVYKQMLNAAPVWVTSAEMAKMRLHGVVPQDRKACGDGKWVKVRNKNPSWIPWHWEFSEDPMFRELAQEWRRHDKMAFRWVYRR